MSGRIVNTNIRLNLDREDDRRAWEHLQRLDRSKYRSYSRAVIAALNGFFDRQELLQTDPYLETREKEDAFLKRVLETVEKGIRSNGLMMERLPQNDKVELSASPTSIASSDFAENEDSEQYVVEDTLMDFIDNF